MLQTAKVFACLQPPTEANGLGAGRGDPKARGGGGAGGGPPQLLKALWNSVARVWESSGKASSRENGNFILHSILDCFRGHYLFSFCSSLILGKDFCLLQTNVSLSQPR